MRRFALLLAVVASAPCCAQSIDDDSAALALADHAEQTSAPVYDWRGAIEAAGVRTAQSYGLSSVSGERLSADARYDGALGSGVRGVLSDRLDVNWFAGMAAAEVNTLREAYVSWQPQAAELIDLGRINVRSGVALGYNPTDFLRSDAVREVVSPDPDSLRANRLGSVMLRGQTLWSTGSLTALVSPRLADAPSAARFSPDLGATNQRNRWSLALSQRLSSNFNPQLLVYGDGQGGAQGGLNMTVLVNPATIAYVEWSGGRSATLLSQSAGTDDARIFASRLATGVTYTTPFRLSVTLEYEANSAALDRTQWDQVRYGPTLAFQRYLEFTSEQQDLPTRRAVFTYWQISDLAWRHFDAAAFSREDLEDHSRLDWVEARYHWAKVDLALQVQHDSGSTHSVFGAAPQQRVVQLLIDTYFP